jgi:hypothetical protein
MRPIDYKIVILVLICVTTFLLVQLILQTEYQHFLEVNNGLQYSFTEIKEGMKKDEVLNKVRTYNERDLISPDEKEVLDNRSSYCWNALNHEGAFRTFFGLNKGFEKNMNHLCVVFDSNEILIDKNIQA